MSRMSQHWQKSVITYEIILSQGTHSFFSISCPHTVVQAARHIDMPGSPYAKEKGVGGVASASSFMHLMPSRTHRRTVVMDSYTWLPSSELFSICLKADVVLRLLKPSQYWWNKLHFLKPIPKNSLPRWMPWQHDSGTHFQPLQVYSAFEPYKLVCMSMFLWGPGKRWKCGLYMYLNKQIILILLLFFSICKSEHALTWSSGSRTVWASLFSGFRVLASWMEMTGSLSCPSHVHISPVRTKGSRSMQSLSQPPPWFSSACTQLGIHVRPYCMCQYVTEGNWNVML